MRQDETNGRLLSSWKEISEFLKCDVKTCRRWERTAGLPVHRVSEISKSRVFAYRDELDDWLRKRAAGGGVRAPVPSKARRRILPWPAVVAVAAVVLSALYLFLVRPRGHRLPFDFRIEHSALVILDSRGRELWRYDTLMDNLEDETSYRSTFQAKRSRPEDRGRLLPHLIIRDINRDKKPEVLFAIRTQDELDAGILVCFDFRGRELWRFRAGRPMTFGSRAYSNEYMISGIETLDADGDGNLETMVIGFQRPDWPTQFVLLDARGKGLGEYWHSGQINDYALADLDKDGRNEIILAGVNNEYQKGCLLAFSPDRIEGGSPQSKPEFVCRDLKPGSERYYLVFPRTDVDIARVPVESVGRISLLNGEKLQAEMLGSGVFYILDFRLAVTDVIISHAFMQMHREAVTAGQVTSVLDDEYRRNLAKGVLYFDGRGWTPNPAPVRRHSNSGQS